MPRVLMFILVFFPCTLAEPVTFTHGKLEVPTYSFRRSEIVAPLFKSIENAGHYPYTILDWSSRLEKPEPVEYESLVLENEYLRVEFLPELGGRIYSAFDKVAKRELFYHPSVIKPGRYNQRGGWPVGNLELYGPFDAHMLTWPGEPWAWACERHPDGSATVVLSHIDHFFRDKISLSVTLRPGHAFLETTIRLYNKNLLPNRYLIWTNAGVGVTEGSRFVYPMTRTIGHDSSALSTWPIINGEDLSWNKNNKNMLGVFGLDIFDNFMSIYDYKTDYGTVCYTNRLLARGMKTWTFGSGLTALRHMATYTDKDGLYMETQSGRFIWDGNYEFIDPGQTDGWTEYWFGTGQLGGLTTATQHVAVYLDLPGQLPGTANLAATATGVFPQAKVELYAGAKAIWSATEDLAVGTVFRSSIALPAKAKESTLNLRIRAQDGQLLLDHTIYPDGAHPNAEYAGDSIPRKFGPLDTLQVEELYQKGLAHEKFGQTDDAEEAYRVALAKDPLFSPVHLRLGLMAMDRFEYGEALASFEKVLERDPRNGDAHYFLGIICAETGKTLEARRHFYRLLPSSSKFGRRDYMLSWLALRDNNWPEATASLARASTVAPLDLSARQAYAYVSRETGRRDEAQKERDAILKLDPTNSFARSEQWFEETGSAGDKSAMEAMDEACAHHPQGYLELSTEYMRLSAWKEAGAVLNRGIAVAQSSGQAPYPLLLYYRAYVAGQEGDNEVATRLLGQARRQELAIDIFPFRYEDTQVLAYARKLAPGDANATVLLGDLLYSCGRRDEAIELWREAVKIDPVHFFALRDLGMALLISQEQKGGLELLTRASVIRPDHLATTMLLADINARVGNADAARKVIERALEKSSGRDVLIEKLASVEAQVGNEARALELLTSHKFEATHQTYSLLHLYRGVRLMMALGAYKQGDFQEALTHVRAAAQPPSSLGIDDYATVKSSRLLMFEALLHQAAGNVAEARSAWKAAAQTRDDDIEGEGLFRAIALLKIGRTKEANEWLHAFPSVNQQRRTDNSIEVRTQAHCLAGIYAAFRGEDTKADEYFNQALDINQSHLYARQARAWLLAGLLAALRKSP